MDQSKWNSIIWGLQSSGVTILSGSNKKSDRDTPRSKEPIKATGIKTETSTEQTGQGSVRNVNEHKVIRELEDRTCSRKTAFPNRKVANWTKAQMAESGLHVYRCPAHPTHWHIGRRHKGWE